MINFNTIELDLLIEAMTDKLAELEERSDNGVTGLEADIATCHDVISMLWHEMMHEFPEEYE